MKTIIGIIIIVLAALVFIDFGSGKHAQVPTETQTNLSLEEKIAQGKSVAHEADCIACHTIEGGGDYAGGLVFETPFGSLYSTNITQDKEYGIGNFTREDFYRAIKYGYSKNSGNLYPAMPYTSYRKLTDSDIDALWAYMQTRSAIPTPNVVNEVMFPANIRFGLGSWNQLFFDDTDFSKVANKSAQWNEGKYLVEAAGHCGECHTPRNFAFAMDSSKALEGAMIEGWEAVSISPQALRERDWTLHSLTKFFETGHSSQGSTFGGMFIVIQKSLSHLTSEQRLAMSIYLLDIKPQDKNIAMKRTSTHLTKQQKSQPGYNTYAAYCAGCHGDSGLGIPNAVVALQGNTIFSEPSSYNAIAVILRGLAKPEKNHLKGVVEMPSFAQSISDEELANIVNFANNTWGNKNSPNITADHVLEIRQELTKEGYLKPKMKQVNL